MRQDIDTRAMWSFAVQASRRAGVPAPRALPLSHDWLFNGNSLTVPEKGALRYAEQLAHKIEESKNADSAEYDPDLGGEFPSASAYTFAFWRLCVQSVTHVERQDGRPMRQDTRRGTDPEKRPLDRVRVIRLRVNRIPNHDGTSGSRYQHRWPVWMHKVRQFYPSLNSHKVLWRGPYIKGPGGAPLLIGSKAQAIT